MAGLHSDLEPERDARAARPPEPAPAQQKAVTPGSLAWASAVGNQAVQALARQEADAPEAEEEQAAGPEAPGEVEEPAEGLAPHEAEALAGLDESEETLPE